MLEQQVPALITDKGGLFQNTMFIHFKDKYNTNILWLMMIEYAQSWKKPMTMGDSCAVPLLSLMVLRGRVGYLKFFRPLSRRRCAAFSVGGSDALVVCQTNSGTLRSH